MLSKRAQRGSFTERLANVAVDVANDVLVRGNNPELISEAAGVKAHAGLSIGCYPIAIPECPSRGDCAKLHILGIEVDRGNITLHQAEEASVLSAAYKEICHEFGCIFNKERSVVRPRPEDHGCYDTVVPDELIPVAER